MSGFTWLDYSEKERQQVLQVIELFREDDTRDELGIGTIRDTIADLLFPGTSTIQTRLRYFLFIPWLLKMIEQKRVPSHKASTRSRDYQGRLRDVLMSQTAGDGVIGAVAGYKVQRLPSNIYWNGLDKWGIRLFHGTEMSYYHSLDGFYDRQRTNRVSADGEPDKEVLVENWDPALPSCPEKLLEKTTFRLKKEEATYLLDRIRTHQPDSLLRHLMERAETVADEVRFVWEHHAIEEMPREIQDQVIHARNFSEVMHGAALLYNLILAEQRSWDERIQNYQKLINQWQNLMHTRKLAIISWNMDAFWNLVREGGGRFTPHTRSFIEKWIGLVRDAGDHHSFSSNNAARNMIVDRERQIKRNRARINNTSLQESWQGNSGAAQLEYRWNVPVRSYLNDMAKALSTKYDHA